MNLEVFEIVKSMDLNDITTQIVLQCAPLISGLKISNLLTIYKENENELRELLENTSISYYFLLAKENKITVLLYKEDDLVSYLSESKVKNFLKQRNYKNLSLNQILPLFKLRYQEYMGNKKEFPHEMGVLLGYPIEDVEGFVYNKGKNFLLTGYWKVYENKPAKEQLFHKFETVKESMIHFVECGLGIGDIIEIYSNGQLHHITV